MLLLAVAMIFRCSHPTLAGDARTEAVNAALWEGGQGRATYRPEDRRRIAEAMAAYWQAMSGQASELVRKDPDPTVAKRYDLWPVAILVDVSDGCAQAFRELAAMAGTDDGKEVLRWARGTNCYDMNMRVNLAEAGLGMDEDRKWAVKFPYHTLWAGMITGPLLGYMLDGARFR